MIVMLVCLVMCGGLVHGMMHDASNVLSNERKYIESVLGPLLLRGHDHMHTLAVHGLPSHICEAQLNGADLDVIDPINGFTPLHYAARVGRVDNMLALLSAGADASLKSFDKRIDRESIGLSGESERWVEVVPGVTPFKMATLNIAISFDDILWLAINGFAAEVVDAPLRLHERLLFLVSLVQPPLMNQMLAHSLANGADVNTHDTCVDAMAVYYALGDAARLRKKSFRVPVAMYGAMPLHYAAYVGNVHAVRALLNAGADPNAVDTDMQATPLHHAAEQGWLAIVDMLIQAAADIGAHDVHTSYNPPLRSHENCVEILAMPLEPTRSTGLTPADYARAGFKEIMKQRAIQLAERVNAQVGNQFPLAAVLIRIESMQMPEGHTCDVIHAIWRCDGWRMLFNLVTALPNLPSAVTSELTFLNVRKLIETRNVHAPILHEIHTGIAAMSNVEQLYALYDIARDNGDLDVLSVLLKHIDLMQCNQLPNAQSAQPVALDLNVQPNMFPGLEFVGTH